MLKKPEQAVGRCRSCSGVNKIDDQSGLCPFCAGNIREAGEKFFGLGLARFVGGLPPWGRLVVTYCLIVPLFCLLSFMASLYFTLPIERNGMVYKDNILFGLLLGFVIGSGLVLIAWTRWYVLFYRRYMRQRESILDELGEER